jgi:phage terminase small subunit
MAGSGQKLTPKQKLFVDEYLIDFNASAAARRAGYKTRPNQIGTENLSKPVIQAYLKKRLCDREKRTEITQDRVLQEYSRLAFNDPRQFFDDDGSLIPIPDLTHDAAACIAGFDAKLIPGEDGKECEILKLKLVDKRASLQDVAKHLGMFEKDNRQKGNHEILVTVEPEDAD